MTKIKAVIFDMDGVLIDAREWHYEALNRALGLFGMQMSRYDHVVTYDGLPTSVKLSMLSRERGLPEKLHPLLNDLKQQYTMELVHSRCKPTFQHQYALARLRREGYRLALCSNSIARTVETMMDRADLRRYLEFHLSNQDVTRAKPDPEMYQVAISRLAIAPGEALVVEDNENGIKSALSAGAHVLSVAGVEDVTYSAVIGKIRELEGQHA